MESSSEEAGMLGQQAALCFRFCTTSDHSSIPVHTVHLSFTSQAGRVLCPALCPPLPAPPPSCPSAPLAPPAWPWCWGHPGCGQRSWGDSLTWLSSLSHAWLPFSSRVTLLFSDHLMGSCPGKDWASLHAQGAWPPSHSLFKEERGSLGPPVEVSESVSASSPAQLL